MTGNADLAWRKVVDGFEEALALPDVPFEDREHLERCYRLAAVRARVSVTKDDNCQRGRREEFPPLAGEILALDKLFHEGGDA
jgi:hypothetical protein